MMRRTTLLLAMSVLVLASCGGGTEENELAGSRTPSASTSAPDPKSSTAASPTEEGPPLLAYGSTDFRYRIVEHGGVGFEQPTFDDSGWAVGTAPFGVSYLSCAAYSSAKTSWGDPHTDLLLRAHFHVPAAKTDTEVAIAIDNNIQVFVNGVEVSDGIQQSEGCAYHDQFVFEIPSGVLVVGDNLLALRAMNDGGPAFVDAEVR